MDRLLSTHYARWTKFDHKRLSQLLVNSYFDREKIYTEEDEDEVVKVVELEGCQCRGECTREMCEGNPKTRNCGMTIISRTLCRNCYNTQLRNNFIVSNTTKKNGERKQERKRRKAKKKEKKKKTTKEMERRVKKEMKKEKKTVKKKKKKKKKKNKKKKEEEEREKEEEAEKSLEVVQWCNMARERFS